MSHESVLYVVAEPEFLTEADMAHQPGKALRLYRYYRRLPAMQEVVQAMCNVAVRPGSIRLLSFQCHGLPGRVTLWESEETFARLELNHSNFALLRPFRRFMARGGRVEFHSCSTGAEFDTANASGGCVPNGRRLARGNLSSYGQYFLQGVADALGCEATAGSWRQFDSIGFCGPTVTFQPAQAVLWSE